MVSFAPSLMLFLSALKCVLFLVELDADHAVPHCHVTSDL